MTTPLQVPPETSLDSNLQTVDVMVDEVASLIGGQLNAATRDRALRFLDRAADRINMAGTFLYRRAEVTYDSGDAEWVADADQFVLPADWGWPTDAAYSFDPDGTKITRIEWQPWDLFRSLGVDDDTTGAPKYASLRSEKDAVALFIWPKLDVGETGKMIFTYIARVQRPSEVSSLIILQETREALISGGEYFAARWRYLKQPNVWRPLYKEFLDTIDGAKAAANRNLQANHMSIYPEESGSLPFGSGFEVLNPNTVYIRVSRGG